ncbi:MAG: Na+/H+ antiporter NhaA [Actinobacteria bacterium]|nr:Na+/H+ antiporter NhaA [Actinomycetota bacterium]
MKRESRGPEGHDAFERIDTPSEKRWLGRVLRDETFGGAVLLVAATVALIIANSPLGDWYGDFRSFEIEISSLNISMTLAKWASDAFLAIFFFVAGLELKHEFVHGSLAKPRQALVPIVAAISGMAVPAFIYISLIRGNPGASDGWAMPVATDIAFALAVLAVAGRGLPTELRAFLLALAVVDDLGAITIIALFYTEELQVNFLIAAGVLLSAYAALQRISFTRWFLMIPLALVIWWCTYQSGIHATVAGVAIALLTSVHARNAKRSPAELSEERIRPISVALAVPFFAFTAAGVDLRSIGIDALENEIAFAVMAGLVIGKPLGVMASTYLLTKVSKARLNENLRWGDLFSVSLLAGIGFTVSLLIAKLSFSEGSIELAAGKTGILVGSLISALLAIIFLRVQKRR